MSPPSSYPNGYLLFQIIMSGAKDTEKAMLVEDDHEDMSSDEEEDTAAAQMGAAQLLKVLIEIFV